MMKGMKMKKSAIPSVLIFGLASALAAVPAFAGTVVLYSDLGPGGGYDPYTGWTVSGSGPGNVVIGSSFTLGTGAAVSDAELELDKYSGDGLMNVYIESDNYGYPGSIIAQLTQTGAVPLYTEDLATFDCIGAACTLAAGSYWLVASEPQADAAIGWAWNFYDDLPVGPDSSWAAYGTSGSPTGPWSFEAPGAGGAFEIDGGTTTPEPSSFLLLGSGLAGLAGLLKRKLRA
jgi:hypothetical protein